MASELITLEQLTGLDDGRLMSSEYPMHNDVVDAWSRLVFAAQRNGIDLAIASGYRSFSRQLTLWNEKALGRRTVFDKNGLPIDISQMTDRELMFAILRWSALPGASRHHWGSDLDVYDKSALDEGDVLDLQATEYAAGARFSNLVGWLDEAFENERGEGFFRPYMGGSKVAIEPWHLSYAPLANKFQQVLTKQRLYDFYCERRDIQLVDDILACFDEIYDRYIFVLD